MRHRRYTVKLGRNSSHRRAMFRNLCVSIIESYGGGGDGLISTMPKLKAVRSIIEKLVSVCVRAYLCDRQLVDDGVAGQLREDLRAECVSLRRVLYRVLRSRTLVDKAVTVVGRAYVSRPGGYVRVLRLHGRRLGDGGVRGLLQWVADGAVSMA